MSHTKNKGYSTYSLDNGLEPYCIIIWFPISFYHILSELNNYRKFLYSNRKFKISCRNIFFRWEKLFFFRNYFWKVNICNDNKAGCYLSKQWSNMAYLNFQIYTHLRRVQKFQLGIGIITRHGVNACQSIFKLGFFNYFYWHPAMTSS